MSIKCLKKFQETTIIIYSTPISAGWTALGAPGTAARASSTDCNEFCTRSTASVIADSELPTVPSASWTAFKVSGTARLWK